MTTFQIVAILVLLLVPRWAPVLVGVVGATAVVAIVDYTRAGIRNLRGGEPAT